MWLFTDFGFFSIVCKPGTKNLCVRARMPGDLEAFRDRLAQVSAFDGANAAEQWPIEDFTGTDYAFRLYASNDDVAALMSEFVKGIDYNNFKGRVGRTQGHDRASVYMNVWSIMNRMQEKAVGWAYGRRTRQ